LIEQLLHTHAQEQAERAHWEARNTVTLTP
jgi:hypothetical protein